MPSGTLYRVPLVRTDVSENIQPPSSGFLRVIGFHKCVAVESLLLSLTIEEHSLWSNNTVLWDAFTAVSIIDAFWDFLSCSSISNRRFGEHIASVFRVP
jgi:hypothetical protein